MLVWSLSDIETNLPPTNPGGRMAVHGQQTYYGLDNGQFVPLNIFERVQEASNDKSGIETSKLTGQQIYQAYVDVTYLRPYVAIPFFLSSFVLLLYLLGKSMAAGIGRFFWHRFELIDPPVALGAERLPAGQAGERLSFQRAGDRVHPRRGRRVSPQRRLVAGIRDRREHARHPLGGQRTGPLRCWCRPLRCP